MAKSLPELMGFVRDARLLLLIYSDTTNFEDKVNKEYLVESNLPKEEEIDRIGEIVSNLASKLDKIHSVYTGTDFNLPEYFKVPKGLSLFEHGYTEKEMGYKVRIGINCDLFVPEFRDAERYFPEYFTAFHNAYPNDITISRWNQPFPDDKVEIVERDGKILKITKDETIDCEEWKRKFNEEVGPEMERRIGKATDIILEVYKKLYDNHVLHFLMYSSVMDVQRRSSSRHDFQGTFEEFLRELPNLFDNNLYDYVSKYPTLTLSRSFEYES